MVHKKAASKSPALAKNQANSNELRATLFRSLRVFIVLGALLFLLYSVADFATIAIESG